MPYTPYDPYRITNQDNGLTLPNRLTYPMGTWVTPPGGPSTIPSGALGASGGINPLGYSVSPSYSQQMNSWYQNAMKPAITGLPQPITPSTAMYRGSGAGPNTILPTTIGTTPLHEPYSGYGQFNSSALSDNSVEMLNWRNRLAAATSQTTLRGPQYPTGRQDMGFDAGALVHIDDGSKNGVDIKNYFSPQDVAYYAAFSGMSQAQALQSLQDSGYVQYGGMMVYNPSGNQGPNPYTNVAGGRGNRSGHAIRNANGTLVTRTSGHPGGRKTPTGAVVNYSQRFGNYQGATG